MGRYVTVERGIALLDERVPGWAERVDPDSLDLNEECGCVLGQLYGGFSEGQKELFGDDPDDRQAQAHGFWAWLAQPWDGSGKWEKLTAVWQREIRRRQAA